MRTHVLYDEGTRYSSSKENLLYIVSETLPF